jgi:AcrR family transcriptional regulator
MRKKTPPGPLQRAETVEAAKQPRRRRNDVRQDVLAAATELFAVRGFAAVSTRDICLAARVPMSGVYRHFPDKLALYRECVLNSFRSVNERVFAPLSQHLSTTETVFRIAESLCELHSKRYASNLLLRQLLESNEQLFREAIRESLSVATRQLESRLADQEMKGGVHQFVFLLYSMSFGLATLAPLVEILNLKFPHTRTSNALAIFILEHIDPARDWSQFRDNRGRRGRSPTPARNSGARR